MQQDLQEASQQVLQQPITVTKNMKNARNLVTRNLRRVGLMTSLEITVKKDQPLVPYVSASLLLALDQMLSQQ